MKLVIAALALAGLVSCGRDTKDQAARSNGGARERGPEPIGSASAPTVPDEELVDQHGRRVKLYTDVIRGHVVVIDFVFTRCTTICSPMTAILARAQKSLRERGITDARFVSISIDPANDTPPRMKELGDRFSVQDGFFLLTGEPARVDRALRALSGSLAAKEVHAPVFLLGNDETGRWKRVFGMVAPSVIADDVIELRDRGAASAHRGGG